MQPPKPADEAVRDLARARDDAREDLQRCRHRLGKLLLRRGLHYAGRNWTRAHRQWIDTLTWTHAAERVPIPDYMPPRAPTISRIVGHEGGINISWTANPEKDLVKYRIYRASVAANDGSIDRMTPLFECGPDGTSIPAGSAPATVSNAGSAYVTLTWDDVQTKPARDYYYRTVAIDRASNISELSASSRGRSVDTTPPAAPTWTSAARAVDSAGALVQLRFAAPAGDPDAKLRIQRQDGNSAIWRPISSWLAAGTVEFSDRTAPTAVAVNYRIQAMDSAGNIGPYGSAQQVQ